MTSKLHTGRYPYSTGRTWISRIFSLDERIAALIPQRFDLDRSRRRRSARATPCPTDPDHLTAVTTLVASGRERAACRAGELGLAWGFGHAATLFAFGVPILVLNSALPHRFSRRRKRRSESSSSTSRSDSSFAGDAVSSASTRIRTRTVADAQGSLCDRLVHGMAGSAGVGVLVLASVRTTGLAVISLAPPGRLHGPLHERPIEVVRLAARLTSPPARRSALLRPLWAGRALSSGLERRRPSLAPYPF